MLNNILVFPVKSVEGNVGANTWIVRTENNRNFEINNTLIELIWIK